MYLKNEYNHLFTLKSENGKQHTKDDSGGSWNHLTKKRKVPSSDRECKEEKYFAKLG